MVLFIWNVAPVVCLAVLSATGGLGFGLPAILVVGDISGIDLFLKVSFLSRFLVLLSS